MKTTGNTILITGGGSGIGFETAKLFAQKGNKVIITGRNAKKLEEAVQYIENGSFISCDVTDEQQVQQLVKTIEKDFGSLNILMNNAGQAMLYKLGEAPNAYKNASAEIMTNYLATVLLTDSLLPLLKQQKEAAVINVSSIVAFSPGLMLPTYSASKAALHSYTQILRLSLSQTSTVKVFEVMPPLVDTEFAKDIASETKISPLAVAEELVKDMEANHYEIKVASTKDFYQHYLSSPENALLSMNGMQHLIAAK